VQYIGISVEKVVDARICQVSLPILIGFFLGFNDCLLDDVLDVELIQGEALLLSLFSDRIQIKSQIGNLSW
jgi:hypothetical protein